MTTEGIGVAPDGVGSPRARAVGRIEEMRSVPWFRLPWGFVFKQTLRGFSKVAATDLAAGLTYFAVLSLFPAMIALVSLLGLVGQSSAGINALFSLVDQVAPGMTKVVRGPIESLASSPATGWALVIGLVGAIWSASGYVGGFGRALNRIYGVQEGRPFMRLRPVQLGVTVASLVLLSVVAILLVVSGPFAHALGSLIGLGDAAVAAWNILRWPIVVVALVILVALLYAATPNVSYPRFRWLTFGSVLAIVVLGIASALFAFYVANFGSYDKTYGTLAGIIVFLLWIYIANVSLLFGAVLDAELERARELASGLDATSEIHLPLKSDQAIVKARDAEAGAILAARAVRRKYRDPALSRSGEAQP
ncbi:YihY/virulence factor BrkB family protein [Leifsonia sp. AG29]|uniref:YihY/virulence factor BrkB family protein n=1 Tax=Leifsonia sp. AG29 TaxID=2598860 RepID=UPI001E41FFFD|nr:YihY/virulence factor BrkB family protein [Leifsonia sp. AG29]